MKNSNEKPKTDLELALNYSGHCIRKDSSDDVAGANAASRVDMFLTKNPVSELVWSPVKGPRVKSAELICTDNKTSLFWDAGQSNIFPLGQDMTGVMFHPDKLIDDNSSPQYNNGAGCIQEREKVNMTHTNPKEHTVDRSGKVVPVPAEVINSGVPEKNEPIFAIQGHVDIEKPENLFLEAKENSTDMPLNERYAGNIGSSNKLLEGDNTVACEIQHRFRHEASSSPVTSSGRLVGRKESTTENESQTSDDPVAVCKIAISLSPHGNENKCQENALVLQCDKNSQPSCCPTSSRTHQYLQKRKGDALSDDDERISTEDEDSHESVESRNSVGHFSTGKKISNFKQQFRSKRVQRSSQETLDSPPLVRRDSSFMNWISNMWKGFSQLRQHEITPPALTFGHSDNHHEMLNQKLVKLSKDQYPGCRSVGFQSIFQSIYSSSSKNTETRKLSVNQQLEDNAINGELVNKLTSTTPMSIASCPEGGTYRKQVFQSSKGFKGSPCSNEVVPHSEVEMSRKIVIAEEMEWGNKNECSLDMRREKERITSTSYYGEHKTNMGTDVIFEAIPSPINRIKEVHGSLWITLSSKSIAPLLDAHHLQISDAGFRKLPQASCNATNEEFRTEGNYQSPTAHVVEQRLKEGIHSVKNSNILLASERLVSGSSNQNNLEENARSSTCNTDEELVSNVPKGIFEAIKKLQISRSDILKWINSPMSVTHLDGFFLRLKLGKWEEGLGGTGYHVASMTGSSRQSLVQNAKTSVSVNVKGVKCLVEIQYISNNDFLEEELMAWWSTTSKGGDNRVPSEKDLIERIKKKESLGF